jgi:dTDP-L-rhamnose 4-epimerase
VSTVAITGGAGFIGLHLGRAFVKAGWDVVALDNLSPQVHLDAAASRAKVPGRLVEGDVLDPEAWGSLPPVDAVVHLAAETGVGQSMYEVERYRSVNVDGTARAATFAGAAGVPLVFFSSRAIYGQGRYACDEHGTTFGDPCCDRAVPAKSTEDDPAVPVSVYGETKVAGERLLVDGAAGDAPVAIVRPQNVIGPGQALHNPYTGVLAAFLARLREGLPLQVYGDGHQTRDFVDVSDVARLVVALVTERPAHDGPLVVNSGIGERTSLLELARYAIDGAPVDGSIEHVEVHRAGDIEHACADLTRFDSLGLPRPEVSTADAVAGFIRHGWDLPGAPAAAWDDALDVLASKGLIT